MNNKKLRNYNLIGISGHKESGKDLVARIIQYLRYKEENPDFSEECINITEESGLENRKFADKVFLWGMKRTSKGLKKPFGFIMAYMYFFSVRLFGSSSFEYRKEKLSLFKINSMF